MSSFREFLQTQSATFDEERGRVASFGSPHDEYRAVAAHDKAGVVPLLDTTPLRLSGADRADFLHGQISNEVRRLAVHAGVTALMLNHKGHALALLRVYRRDEDLFVAVEAGAGETVEAQLTRHIIFDQVTVTNLDDTIVSLSVQGGAAADVVGAVFGVPHSDLPRGEVFTHYPFADAKVLVAPVARSVAGGFDLHVLARDAAALCTKLSEAGAVLVGQEGLELARVEAGLPSAATEAGPGVLPQEVGLEPAISYRKGCYLGQEIMARIEARGNVRNQLAGVSLEKMPTETTLTQNGKKVGELKTVVEHPDLGVIALAKLKTDVVAGSELFAGEVRAKSRALPFRGSPQPA
ncbi:MAG: hypothetical protein U5L04_05175 [Trueperaceae bacterium]|nr:hypothetical protein [Trueperaceae bacterium]